MPISLVRFYTRDHDHFYGFAVSVGNLCIFFSASLVESVIPMLLRNVKSWTYWCQGSLLHGMANVHNEVALCLGQRFDNRGPHVWGDGQCSVGQLSA